MPQPQRNRRLRQQERRDREFFNTPYIFQFFGIWILSALIAFGMKMIVLYAFSISPTNRVGNGILTLYEEHGTSAAFNLFGGNQEAIITASMVLLLAITFVVLGASTKLKQAMISAMAFLCAGVSMNMFERMQNGYVINYVHCDFMPNFPVFNVPDIMVAIGTVCLLLSLITAGGSNKK